MTYLNCAATSLERPPEVRDAIAEALVSCGSYGRGAHATDLAAVRVVEGAREAVAGLLGVADPGRLGFFLNATDALNCAICGLVREGDHVVATDWDHNSVLRPLSRMVRERHATVDFVPAGADGSLDMLAFARLLASPTRLVVVTHASNLTGQAVDDRTIADVVALAHAAGALVLLDASQTAGCLPLDMGALGVDILCCAGHKALMGPTGTGVCAVAPGVDLAPWRVGGTGVDSKNPDQPDSWPERLEAGTPNVCGIAGLGAAATWLSREGAVAQIREHERALSERFLAGVADLAAPSAQSSPSDPSDPTDPTDATLTLYGQPSYGQVPDLPVFLLNMRGWDPATLADALARDYDIACRAGIHCAPRMHRALGTYDTGALRLSFGAFTAEKDVELAARALHELAVM